MNESMRSASRRGNAVSVEESDIVKELNRYLYGHPEETAALMPLYEAVHEHSQFRGCFHEGRCPVVKAGAVLVDEQERTLVLRDRDRWALAEDIPRPGDDTLSRTAQRVLAEFAGVYDVWTSPGAEGPLIIDVSAAAPEDGPRARFGFRYLFRAHSGALFPSMAESGAACWRPISQVSEPRLRARLAHQLSVAL
jgi:hypothetical protein